MVLVCFVFFQDRMEHNDLVVDLMAEAINHYKRVGYHHAWLNWFECFDIDHVSVEYNNKKADIRDCERSFQVLKERLSRWLTVGQLNRWVSECLKEWESSQEMVEREIEAEHRPSNIHFNENALIILTDAVIPEDIRIALSFGYKFLFPFECNNRNMHEILAQLEMTIEEALPDLKQDEAATLIGRILNRRDKFQEDNNLKWLKFISNRTSAFFKKNAHLFATKSDKGAHTVVAEVASYEQKLASLLSDNNYAELDRDPLTDSIETILIEKDKIFYQALHDNEKIKKLFGGLPLYEPDTLIFAKFYGLFKIHKKGIPLRPITSTIGSPGYLLAKVFAKVLDKIFPRTSHHIKDSYEFVTFVNGVSIGNDDILVSFDVVSMYTSIPFELVKDIIMSRADKFLKYFDIDDDLLLRLIEYLLKDCMIFSALGKNYRQIDGLPMGSCLSPILARMVMDRVIDDLLFKVPQISFIRVFVDDSIASVGRNFVEMALQVLNSFRPGQIKFTIEYENNHASINFLNTTLMRENDKIICCWFRKSFYSGRLLNRLSSHKRTTVMGTAVNFIQTVLRLSDARFFHENIPKVRRTLLENNFPEILVVVLMNSFYTLMKPLTKPVHQKISDQFVLIDGKLVKKVYKLFPHSICKGRDIKKIIHDLKSPGIVLADSVRNTRINAIHTRKTITPFERRKNVILIARCVCKKKFKIVRTGFNETGGVTLRRIVTHKNICDRHSHAYKSSDIRFRKGLFYDGQTGHLVKYIQWMYRKRLDVSQGRYEWPRFLKQFGKFFQ